MAERGTCACVTWQGRETDRGVPDRRLVDDAADHLLTAAEVGGKVLEALHGGKTEL